jgi:hypothetical protein
VERRLHLHVLAAGEERVERGLLEGGADRGTHLGALAHDVVAGDACGAGCGRQQRREHVHRGGLAGPVWPEEAVDLARRDLQVDPVDRARALLELADEALDLDAGVVHRRTVARYLLM